MQSQKEDLDVVETLQGPPIEPPDEHLEVVDTNDDLPQVYPHPNRHYERPRSQPIPKGKGPEYVWQKEGADEDLVVAFPHLNENHEPLQSVLIPKKRTLGTIAERWRSRWRSMFKSQPGLGQRRPDRGPIDKVDRVKPSQELINKLDKGGLRCHSYRCT